MKRAGRTETMSISLSAEPLGVLRRRAKQVHKGNLSAAIAEAAEFLRRDMAMGELVSELESEHGSLTDRERAEIEAELRPSAATPRGRKRSTR